MKRQLVRVMGRHHDDGGPSESSGRQTYERPVHEVRLHDLDSLTAEFAGQPRDRRGICGSGSRAESERQNTERTHVVLKGSRRTDAPHRKPSTVEAAGLDQRAEVGVGPRIRNHVHDRYAGP